MTATTLEPTGATSVVAAERGGHPPIPFSRLTGVELRKMFDTRSGFWLMASVGILATLATAAFIVFAPESEQTYEGFASAIGFPMAVILPMIAVLSVTSEWSQRSGLTTFTFVPNRGRVIGAKLAGVLVVAVVSMLLAAAIGAVGNVVGTAIAGVDTTWNISVAEFAHIVLANVLGMLVGFMLGVLVRSSAAAIVAYFVYSLLLPTVSSALAASQDWWADNGPWFDFNYASSRLFEASMSGQDWAQLATSGSVWLLLPLVVGLRLVVRSEVK